MSERVKNILLSVLLIVIWQWILSASFVLFIVSDIIQIFGGGILKYIFVFVYILAVLLPIIFRKRLGKFASLPLVMLVFAVFSVMVNGGIYLGVKGYISEYDSTKWNEMERLRIYMTDDMEEELNILGKTDTEVELLLGATVKSETGDGKVVYEYYAGEGLMDPITYDIIFENGVAIKTRITEH